ncbi:MAG: HD-like signal output (HDOD) protein [Lentisphaeria bacterium]|jgi:HD-like signal output (HDOD) protein
MSNNNAFVLVREKLIQRIRDNHLEVPMLPKVAGKVVSLTQDPDSDASALAQLIQSDQTLAGHVMRVANSAAYSPNSSILSLQQAITRLGTKLISEIALSASINSTLFNTPGFEKHIAYGIKHSLASGLWAKEAARACRKNVEASFLSGLLHDIGRPVAVQSALEIAKSLHLDLDQEHVLKIENQFQREIGIRVVEKWQMPKTVCNVVRYFDDYGHSHASQALTMSVAAGALIAGHFMCEDGDESHCITLPDLYAQPVLADLNLYQDDIQRVLERHSVVKDTLEIMSS